MLKLFKISLKIKNFAFLLLSMLVLISQSCKKGDNDSSDITLSVDVNRATAAAGEEVVFNISAASQAKITKVKIVEKSTGKTLLDTAASSQKYGNQYFYTIPSNATGNAELEFTITNGNNKTKTVFYAITIGGTAPSRYPNLYLGDQSFTPIGSFFSTKDGKVYKSDEVKGKISVQSDIDIIYLYDGDATIAAPDFSLLNIYFDAFKDWSGPKNATKFKKALYFTEYEKVNSTELIKSLYESNSDDPKTNISELVDGITIHFKTTNGKYGILKVKEFVIVPAATRIIIDVKVEK
jgi:hypothetical protein